VISVPYSAPPRGSARFAAALLRSWLGSSALDVWRWRVPALHHLVTRTIMTENVDLCVADFLVTTPNVPLAGPVPVLLFAHNIEHMIWKRLSQVDTRLFRRTVLRREWRKVRRWETQACAQAQLTVAVSEDDRGALAALAPRARVVAIPTGVDLAYFVPNVVAEAPAQLVFTGSMDWYPNEDAIVHFLDAIFPAIRREIPETRLAVVGRNPTSRMRRAGAQANVSVTGTVDDVRPYVSEAAVYIVPLRIGGGTRLKIFEALAMGKAVVATGVGAEGLPLVPGVHFVRADDPAEFARAVVALLRDPFKRKALGTAGRRLVEERFSWARVTCEFESRCVEMLTSVAR
jgi:polysaccharide biosynthesis protein PslH